MSGIFGFYNSQFAGNHDLLDQQIAAHRLQSSAKQQVACVHFEFGILGRSDLGVFERPPLVAPSGDAPVMVSAGYSVADGQNGLGWDRSNLDAIGTTLEGEHYDSLAAVNGTFQIAHLTADGQTLRLVTDRFGLVPLFVYEHAPLLAFAPDLPLLLTLIRGSSPGSNFTPILDRAALAEWFEIGMVMGRRTLLRDIDVMPAGSVLTWDGAHSRVRRYWRPRFSEDDGAFDLGKTSDALEAALRQSLRRRFPPNKRVCVSLSGGLDSRLLLGAARREGLSVSALTFGPEDSSDHTIAAAVAGHLGVTHLQYFDHPENSAATFDLGIRRTAGMSNVLDFWGLQHGPVIGAETDILINGIGGNELLGFLGFDLVRFQVPRNRDFLTRWLLRKLNPGWSAADLVSIRNALAPDEETTGVRIAEFWTNCPATSNLCRIYHFYLEEKSHRSNALGVATDDLFAEPVAPFLDNDVADLALQIPPGRRLLARFYREFMQTRFPALARITYSRTGLPANASTLKIATTKGRHMLVPSAADPSRPWDRWLHRELREYVCDRLLPSGSGLSEVFPDEFIRDRVSAFLSGSRVKTSCIGQLLSLASFLNQFKPSIS